MSEGDNVVKITLAEIYAILLDTQTKLAKLLTEVEYANHEKRITSLENVQWKVTGIAAGVAGVVTFALTLI